MSLIKGETNRERIRGITIKYTLLLDLPTRKRKRYHFSAMVLRSDYGVINKLFPLITGRRRWVLPAFRHYLLAGEILPGFGLRLPAFFICAFSSAPKVAWRKSVAPVTP